MGIRSRAFTREIGFPPIPVTEADPPPTHTQQPPAPHHRSDVGAQTLCRSLRNRPALLDIGITLSDLSDAGCEKLAAALQTCPKLRFV